jgi:hypothetical protein
MGTSTEVRDPPDIVQRPGYVSGSDSDEFSALDLRARDYDRVSNPAGGWLALGGFSCTHSHFKRLSIGLSVLALATDCP